MALQGSYTDDTGTTHTEAYAKVNNIRMDYLGEKAMTVVDIFHDAAARNSGKKPVATSSFVFTATAGDLDSFDDVFDMAHLNPLDSNPTKNVYLQIKTLAEFSGWSDV